MKEEGQLMGLSQDHVDVFKNAFSQLTGRYLTEFIPKVFQFP